MRPEMVMVPVESALNEASPVVSALVAPKAPVTVIVVTPRTSKKPPTRAAMVSVVMSPPTKTLPVPSTRPRLIVVMVPSMAMSLSPASVAEIASAASDASSVLMTSKFVSVPVLEVIDTDEAIVVFERRSVLVPASKLAEPGPTSVMVTVPPPVPLKRKKINRQEVDA